MLSTQHIFGLKEHGYMDLESKIDKYKHFYKTASPPYASVGDDTAETKEKKVASEEFYRFKEGQDVLNGELVHKEVETELLRLDHYNF